MLRYRIIPCLLLKNGGLVKTRKFKNPQYIGDPVNAVKIYNGKEVDELVFLDIRATLEKRPPNFEVIRQLAEECFMPIAYGGGVCRVEDVREIFRLGVEKVIINTAAVESPDFVARLADIFGSQSIVVSADIKKTLTGRQMVFSRSGTQKSGYELEAFLELMEIKGAGEILLHMVDRDGEMNGYELSLIQRAVKSVNLPVIACGGAGELGDLRKAIHTGGASAVAAGSLFVYQSRQRAVLINYPDRQQVEEINRAF